jgi:hypothetical protein
LGWSDFWLPGFRLQPGSIRVKIEAGNFFIASLGEVPPLTRRATKFASSQFPTARFRLRQKRRHDDRAGVSESVVTTRALEGLDG